MLPSTIVRPRGATAIAALPPSAKSSMVLIPSSLVHSCSVKRTRQCRKIVVVEPEKKNDLGRNECVDKTRVVPDKNQNLKESGEFTR